MKDISWGRGNNGRLLDRWPKNADGTPEEPVFLTRVSSLDMSDELTVNMLEAYNIPCLKVYPGNGAFGKLVLGMSGEGMDILVPQSMYEQASELINDSEGVFEDEEL